MAFVPATARSLLTGRLAATLTLLIAGLAWPAASDAAPRKARLSADLVDHLQIGSPSIDVIVHGTRGEVEALARKYNVRVKKFMRSGAVLSVTAGQLAALQEDESLEHLSADVPIRSIADVTAESIGADQVWAGGERLPALSGAGIGIAVIDSGVDLRHAALRSRVVYSVDFTGGDGGDRYGHGTHVAGIIAGTAGRTPDTADYRGIASGARIINLRVLGSDGSGMASDVIEAIDWAVENRKRFDIQVINLSLGAPVTQPYRDDPMCEAVQRAVAAGIIVVAAAGNNGVNAEGQTVYGSIVTPGNDPSVITVGAIDTHGTAMRSDDTIARYSSRGPTRFDLVLKPDLVAPGSRVVAAEAAGSHLARRYPERHVSGSGENAYIQLSGTSMAAGVVSGTVALLLEQNAKLTPRSAKALLQMTSSFVSGAGLVSSGAGLVNALSAASLASSAKHFSANSHVAGESVRASGIRYWNAIVVNNSIVWDTSIVRDTRVKHDSIVWDTRLNPSHWWELMVSNTADSIVWDTAESIVWDTADSIVWDTTLIDEN
jgi:serine protease AprX